MTASATYRPWSLRELVGEIAAGRTTAADALSRSRRRIAATEPTLHAWVVVGETAPHVPVHPGPLGGVPLGVKDIIDVAGYPTRCGSVLRADAVPAGADAAVVTAWRRAGALPVGKTVTTEFAFFAPGPTDNPAAPGHTPGGSSSGSAAAVAAGQVPLALASQTAGSVTRPAAYCGVASLVLSRGAIPTDGVTGLADSLDSHGVYAAGVTDLALAWSALTGAPDAGARPARAPRLLLCPAQVLGVVEPEMVAALARAGELLATAGAGVTPFGPEDVVGELTAAHPVVMAYEAARERAAELAQADRLSDPLATLLRTGRDTPEAAYRAARDVVAAGRAQVEALLADHDAVLLPAAPGPAPAGLGATGDPVLSRAWQALGLPQLTVPGLRSADGRPLGVQLVGRAGGETALLEVGCWVQAVLAG